LGVTVTNGADWHEGSHLGTILDKREVSHVEA